MLNRILYNNNGLWLYDEELGRLYPGILEFENFNNKEKIEQSLSRSIYYGNQNTRAAAELILEDINEVKEFDPIYYNEEKYKEWVEWYKAGVTEGAGGRKGKIKKFHVLIKKDEDLVPGNLTITTLIPNR